MKNNWQIEKLGEVCDFLNGLWKGKEPPYIKVGVIRNTNFTKEGKLDDSDIAYLDVEKKQFENRKLNYGDIILEKSGGGPKQPVGRVVIFDKQEGDFSFSNFTSALRVKNSNELNYDYLHRFLFYSYISGITESIQSHSTGIRNLDSRLYKEIQVPVPPIEEQKRIVGILDEVFGKIAKAKENTEKNLQNSKELFESYLQNIFSNTDKNWKEKTLKEIISLLGDGLHGTPKYTIDGEYYFINGNNLNNGKIVFKENTKRVSVEEYNKYKKNLNNRTILVSINGTLCNIAFFNNEKIILGKSACYFNLLDGIEKNFIKYIILSPYFIKYAFKEATGVTIKNVSLKTMREFKIYLPELKEQKSIVAKLDALSEQTKKLEEIYKQKLADLDELKKSVLKKAFEGEL